MTKRLCILFLVVNPCFAQHDHSVIWHFNRDSISRDQTTLVISAEIALGWHLYSQFMKEGGPRPTKFVFEKDDNYFLIGRAEEKGAQVKFYDDIYEMEIIWYSGRVSFIQKIGLSGRPIVKGKIEYMVCNDAVCVPNTQPFTFDLKSVTKAP